MSLAVKKKIKISIKSKNIKVTSVCSICGEPVCATTKDNAYRHGFKRYKMKKTSGYFSQEDGRCQEENEKPITYQKRIKK